MGIGSNKVENVDFYISKSSELRSNKDYEAADAIIERGIAAYPDCADLYLQYARNSENRGNFYLEHLRRRTFVAICPTSPVGRAALCNTLLKSGETGMAAKVIRQAIEILGQLPEIMECQARVFEARYEWLSAINQWNFISGVPDTNI